MANDLKIFAKENSPLATRCIPEPKTYQKQLIAKELTRICKFQQVKRTQSSSLCPNFGKKISNQQHRLRFNRPSAPEFCRRDPAGVRCFVFRL